MELSTHALDFLHNIYAFVAKTTKVNESPMRKLFEPAPEIPLREFEGEISLERFICLWHMYAILDYRGCYRALLYIGYDRKLDECFSVVRGKSRYSDLVKIR